MTSTSPESFAAREYLAFDRIPGQTKLFLDFVRNEPALQKFYPTVVHSHAELVHHVPEVLNNYQTDRRALTEILLAQNRSYNASARTLENIGKLAESDAVAVVTGQQAGLFTGELYTVYKALSAIKLARCLSERGVKAVPVFWIASEDADFAEVAAANVINRTGALEQIKVSPDLHREGLPVGAVTLDGTIKDTIAALFDALPASEFSGELQTQIVAAYSAGESYETGFARLFADWFGEYGLVLLNPFDKRLKQLAAPVYKRAVEKSDELAHALVARSRELEADGYHAQVLTIENSFPLFWHDDTGARHTLIKTSDGRLQTKATKIDFSTEEVVDLIEREPHRFSPNVALRATVQDYLLPTIVYIGGAAEVSYFAQTAETYRILERPATAIFPRAGLTIVEPSVRRTLEKYQLKIDDFFDEPEILLMRVFENHRIKASFESVTDTINRELDFLQTELLAAEPTLAASLERRRGRIAGHLDALHLKFKRATIEKDQTAKRRIENAVAAVYPREGLQERTLNAASFLARYGTRFFDWVYEEIELDRREHHVLYL